jgi:D-alanyl-D-alanine carboxypeptidase
MRNQEKRGKRISTVVVLALGILMATMAAPAQAASPTVAVMSTSVSGNNVNVTVKNLTLLPRVAMVNVTATVNGSSVTKSVTTTLLPYQTATVSASFCSVVSVLGGVAIVDDNSPF